MKKLAFASLLWLAAALTIGSCKKDNSTTSTSTGTGSLQASKTTAIKQNEPVAFRFNNPPAGATVSWSVSPASTAQITSKADSAIILFTASGSYTVSAKAGSQTMTTVVSVNDSVYTAVTYSTVALTSDNIALTPAVYDTLGQYGLMISAQTAKSYTGNANFLNVNATYSAMQDSLSFTGVSTPSTTQTGQSPATAKLATPRKQDGTYTFKVMLNGTLYFGSYVKSGGKFTFTWPYSSGVTISPLTVSN